MKVWIGKVSKILEILHSSFFFLQIFDEEFVLMVLGKLTELALEEVIPHRC